MQLTRNFPAWSLLIIVILASCSKDPKDQPSSDKNILTFQFTINENSSLPQDIIGEIGTAAIYAVAFPGTDRSALKPQFSFQGAEITVAGKTQSSGQTAQDFATPVTYTVKATDGTTKSYTVKFTDTQVPAVYINTDNMPVDSKETYVNGFINIKANLGGDSIYAGKIEIRGRGNSTWGMPKKPYKIKLDKKIALMGMNENKQWVLLENYADKSLIRNELAFELSRRIGLAYTPAGKFVDLVLNGSYMGNYELVEQVDVGKNKVNVMEQDPAETTMPGISGGYLLEMDGFAFTETVHFNTQHGMTASVHYPDDGDINDAQKNYISSYFNAFEDRLFSLGFDDPVNGYRLFFDTESYINFYLVNEIIGNPDLFWSSYMYKNRDNDLIYTGPVWDFDIAANNDSRLGDAVNQLMLDAGHEPKQWINRLMEDKQFRNGIRARWNQLKNTQLASIGSFIDQLAARLAVSQQKNFTRWPILKEKVYLNLQAAGSYTGELNYLKTFLNTRIAWLDTTFNGSRFD